MTIYRVSADIGGTFTDVVVEPSDGPTFVGKYPTTPHNPSEGIISGIRDLVPDMSQIDFFVHGTTVGLNAFLERRGERVLLITTAGIGDSFTIARGSRTRLYDLHYRKPKPLVPRRDVHEVRERLTWDGKVIEPLNHPDFDSIIEKVKGEDIHAVAVCFLHAFAHPQHEIEAKQILSKALPGVSISCSHETSREWREYERASTTVLNAYIAPVVGRYLKSLSEKSAESHMTATVHVMQSSGGVMVADVARENPVVTLLSGPVGGCIAGMALSKSTGRPNLLCVDMGGTSFDLSLVVNGAATTNLEAKLEGFPVLMPVVDIQTIGTGGGSIAWLENNALRVGPHSAGSVPGPACYGRGGTEPTVTDANLYLKRLGAASLLGGEMTLDEEAANKAISSLSATANISPLELAEGILAISNAAMANAMRTITISEGVDPREFALVAFGGAGPMAAAFLAEELDIAEVVIPKFPGTFSAWGMLQTDLRQDFAVNFYQNADATELSEMDAHFQKMEEQGRTAIQIQGGVQTEVSVQRTADVRYSGQEYTINMPVAKDGTVEQIKNDFHVAYKRRYGHSSPGAAVEFVNLRLAAFGSLRKFSAATDLNPETVGPAEIGMRRAIFNRTEWDTPCYARDRLESSFQAEGPMIIEEQSATTIVPPGWAVRFDDARNIILRRSI